MAACGCPGCGGHPQYLEEKRAQLEANRADFEAWLAAGQPSKEEWASIKAAQGDKAYSETQPEPVA